MDSQTLANFIAPGDDPAADIHGSLIEARAAEATLNEAGHPTSGVFGVAGPDNLVPLSSLLQWGLAETDVLRLVVAVGGRMVPPRRVPKFLAEHAERTQLSRYRYPEAALAEFPESTRHRIHIPLAEAEAALAIVRREIPEAALRLFDYERAELREPWPGLPAAEPLAYVVVVRETDGAPLVVLTAGTIEAEPLGEGEGGKEGEGNPAAVPAVPTGAVQ